MTLSISESSLIRDLILLNPEVGVILEKFGMGCRECLLSTYETLGDGVKMHGLDIKKLIAELNKIEE